jgi:crossover junction endodeoxyribonuclease RuvC
MIIMGIDPGTAKTGYAIIETNSKQEIPLLHDVSCINTQAGLGMHIRLRQLHDELLSLAEEYKPELMVVEKLFFNTNAKTAMSVGQARGIPLLVAAKMDINIVEYTALQAKLVLTGYGRSSKKEMQEAVRKVMNLDEVVKPDDANDALAMALCYINKSKKASEDAGKISKKNKQKS